MSLWTFKAFRRTPNGSFENVATVKDANEPLIVDVVIDLFTNGNWTLDPIGGPETLAFMTTNGSDYVTIEEQK